MYYLSTLAYFVVYLACLTNCQEKTVFSFDDIFNPSYRPKSFQLTWLKDSPDFLYRDDVTRNLMRYNVTDGATNIFLSAAVFNEYGNSSYAISPDLKYVLFPKNIKMRYRRSYRASYTIYDIVANSPILLSTGAVLEYAGWSPTGNALTYVDGKNDLYFMASPSGLPQKLNPDTGDVIFNGIPDWLYEEDVIESRLSHYWSPDSSHIAFASIDDTGVPLQDVLFYGPDTNMYGNTVKIPYPKAGDVLANGTLGTNPKVRMYLVKVEGVTNPTAVELDPPSEFRDPNERYFISAYFKNSNSAMVTWANRVQDQSISIIYSLVGGTVSMANNLNYNVNGGWVQMSDTERIFIEGGDRYLMIFPKGTSPDTFRVPVVISANSTSVSLEEVKPLFNDNFETDAILAVDTNGIAYFSTTFGDASERHIAKVGIAGSASETVPLTCLTCKYPPSCRYVSASFNFDASFYLEICAGPEVPTYTLRKTSDSTFGVIMESNDVLKKTLETKWMPSKKYFNFKTLAGDYTASGQIYTPPDPQPGEKFKTLVYTYAGPGTQMVLKTFPLGGSTNNWLAYLGSSLRVAVVSLDGRGTAGKGDKMKFEMHKNMGTVEVADQIAGTKEAISKFEDLDASPNSSAIFGWSYGGFTSAHVLSDPGNYFRCAISVAPVTDQAFYDSAYTERYLGLDRDDGKKVYQTASVLNKINGFKNKIYMIAHGIADDNVHFMHATHLIRSLEDADIMFRQIVYPDETHSINTPTRSRHLYHSMSQFLTKECWPDYSGSNLFKPSLFLSLSTLYYLFKILV